MAKNTLAAAAMRYDIAGRAMMAAKGGVISQTARMVRAEKAALAGHSQAPVEVSTQAYQRAVESFGIAEGRLAELHEGSWHVNADSSLGEALRRLNEIPPGHHLIGSLTSEIGVCLEGQSQHPPAGRTDMAKRGLKKLVANAFNQLPAEHWSLSRRDQLAAFQKRIQDEAGPISASTAKIIMFEASECIADIMESGPPPLAVSSRMIRDETRLKIADDVADQFVAWHALVDSENPCVKHDLTDTHVFPALLMNALMTHQGIDVWDEKTLPGDKEMNRLFRKTLLSVMADPRIAEDAQESLKEMCDIRFTPRLADTFRWLKTKFEELPELRQVPLNERWRLLGVEAYFLKALDAVGIPANNPLLAFMFEADVKDEPRYANRMAQARWLAVATQDRPLTDALALDIHEVASGSAVSVGPVRYATRCTPEGVLRLADHMEVLQSHGIDSQIILEHDDAHGYCFDGKRGLKLKVADLDHRAGRCAPPEDLDVLYPPLDAAEHLRDVIAREAQHASTFFFERAELPGDNDEAKLAAANAELRHLLSGVDGIEEMSPDVALRALSTLAVNGEHSHLMANGNMRWFLLLLIDHLRAKLGWPLSEPEDPAGAEGGSYAQVDHQYATGVSVRNAWGQPDAANDITS